MANQVGKLQKLQGGGGGGCWGRFEKQKQNCPASEGFMDIFWNYTIRVALEILEVSN